MEVNYGVIFVNVFNLCMQEMQKLSGFKMDTYDQ